MGYDVKMVKRVYGSDFDKFVDKVESEMRDAKNPSKKERLSRFLRELKR